MRNPQFGEQAHSPARASGGKGKEVVAATEEPLTDTVQHLSDTQSVDTFHVGFCYAASDA